MSDLFEAAYVALLRSGELDQRGREASRHLDRCDLCANHCAVNRHETLDGVVCRTGDRAIVSSYGPHHGEENPLRGWKGSGTIFFGWCNLRCVYCQNWEISHKGVGREVTADELARIMLDLQRSGCHNINFVSPSHVVAQIIEAVRRAVETGLRLPLVYNTGGYDSIEALTLLDGIVDIYMPDMKYGEAAAARRYSAARDYVEVNRAAVREMHRQVGDLDIDPSGIARRGLLVRHLVLPGDLAGSESVISFLADEISRRTYLNIMSQYHPCYHADRYSELSRPVTAAEYAEVVTLARRHGLTRLD